MWRRQLIYTCNTARAKSLTASLSLPLEIIDFLFWIGWLQVTTWRPCWCLGTIRFFSSVSYLPFSLKLCDQIIFCFGTNKAAMHLYARWKNTDSYSDRIDPENPYWAIRELCYAMPCGAVLYYSMLSYATLCYAMLCYIVELCYIPHSWHITHGFFEMFSSKEWEDLGTWAKWLSFC